MSNTKSMKTRLPNLTCILMNIFFPLLALTSTDTNTQFVQRFPRRQSHPQRDCTSPFQWPATANQQLSAQSGLCLLPKTNQVCQILSFSTTFVFAIHPNITNHGSEGLTFVISPSMNFNHALPDEFLGLFNSTSIGLTSNHIFAIELDTIQNAHFGDIDGNHVGIDVNDLRSSYAASASYYSTKAGKNESLVLTSSKPMQLWVDYDDLTMLISVTIAPLKVPKPSFSLLSAKINLSGVIMDTMYIGFSSATAISTNDHYVLGWSWNQSGQAQGLDPTKLPSIPKFATTNKKPGRAFLALLISVLILLAAIMFYVYAIRMKKYEEVQEAWEKEYASNRFSYKDLYKATKGFNNTELLGRGGSGSAYKGVIRSQNNLQVAVKRVSQESGEGMKEFIAEILSMRRLRHRNLVQLLGYCRRKGELLLVYDYMPNGSLDKYLIRDKNPALSWHQRFRIIQGVAAALLYLHEEWEQILLHRDIKASNVLLDANMNARLGDFGLARLYDHGTNPRTTHVVGTVGYMAPEFLRTGKATTSSDVFAYGAFVLEVASGRSPVEMKCVDREEEEDLLEWVLNLQKNGLILEASDPMLGGGYDEKEMEMVLKIGLYCSHFDPETRPSMRQVVQVLDGAAVLPDIPSNLNSGQMFSSLPSSVFPKDHSASFYSTNSILQGGR